MENSRYTPGNIVHVQVTCYYAGTHRHTKSYILWTKGLNYMRVHKGLYSSTGTHLVHKVNPLYIMYAYTRV